MTPAFSESSRTELVVISADTEQALVDEISLVMQYVDKVPDATLLDVAYTCSMVHGRYVLAVIASSTRDLFQRLASAKSRLELGTAARIKDKSGTYFFREHLLGPSRPGKLAFVYPGVMSFYFDMLRDLAIVHQECRGPFDELEEALADEQEFTPSSFIFPPASYYRHDADIFKSGAYAQALVSTFAASAALTRLLEFGGLRPDGDVGCAGGDLAAVIKSGAAGKSTRPMRVRAIADIYRIVDKAVSHEGLPKAAMVSAILRHEGEAEPVLASFPPGKVVLALDISPRQKTYAIDPDFEAEAMRAFAAAGIRTMKLKLEVPFNTAQCERIVPAVKKFAKEWMRHEPECDVYSCSTAALLSPKPRVARNDTAERWAKPIRFRETIDRMYADGYRVFVEVGPRGLLTSAIEDILEGREFAAIPLNSIHRRGVLQAQHGVAQLMALGAEMDISGLFARRGASLCDFTSTDSRDLRRYTEQRLSRAFPTLTLLGEEEAIPGSEYLAEPKGRGAKAAARKAALSASARLQRQFETGAMLPLVSDADVVQESPGVSCELLKTFSLAATPFVADSAYGGSQLSYADPSLRGLVMLSIPVGAEIMAEAAVRLIPGRERAVVVAIDDLVCRRQVQFTKGKLKLFIRAERESSPDPKTAAVKVQLRTESPDAQYTWPVMEATLLLSTEMPPPIPVSVEDLPSPRSVHWSGREIYPMRLGYGSTLRGIAFVESWDTVGLDYQVDVPPLAGAVSFTQMPIWEINPLLLHIVASGFMLWRSHERCAGVFSFPFRLRHLGLRSGPPRPGSRLNCYLRLTSVTPRSHLCDIVVTGGDGNEIMELRGWEEIAERVPEEYCAAILQPGTSFITKSLSNDAIGDPSTAFASAYVTDVPYKLFERDEELWLKILSNVVLNAHERTVFAGMKGSVSRRTEWLFGRIAAKDAVRRYLKIFHFARWSFADVEIWANEDGKPVAIGKWSDSINTRIDIAIAHTAQFVVAVAAAAARVGVDVESASRNLSEDFAAGVFVPEERELAAHAVNPSQALIRFWCAKEAVSKALGTGIRFPPKEMVVTGYLPETGGIAIRLTGQWVDAFKNLKGRDITVSTRAMREHVLAFCFIPATLFDDGTE